MSKCRSCDLNRLALTDEAFAKCEEAKQLSSKSIEMALYAEAIGAKQTAARLRATAMLFSRADLQLRAIIREGYVTKRRRERRRAKSS